MAEVLANRDVDALFRAAGFSVVSQEVKGLTPHELVALYLRGGDWEVEASPATCEATRSLRARWTRTGDASWNLGVRRGQEAVTDQLPPSVEQRLCSGIP